MAKTKYFRPTSKTIFIESIHDLLMLPQGCQRQIICKENFKEKKLRVRLLSIETVKKPLNSHMNS